MTIGLLVGAIIFFWGMWRHSKASTKMKFSEFVTRPPLANRLAEAEKQKEAAQPSFGEVMVTTGKWTLVTSCSDPTKRIDATILGDAPCWARLDYSTNRVYPIYPPHWKPGAHLEISSGFNAIEIMVQDGQAVTTEKVGWAHNPRRTTL